MPGSPSFTVSYVTSSAFKREECQVLCSTARLNDGRLLGEAISFEFREATIVETLEVDIARMVEAEVLSAYYAIKIPCIVEHAGLIFDDYRVNSYPGGLTKPMWDTLGDRFIAETNSGGRRVMARAVVGYCDGKRIRSFVGERAGKIANAPRGQRSFYWDTVFIPDDPRQAEPLLTYAEIVESDSLGLPYKMGLSQSGIALLKFAEYALREENKPALWQYV